MSWIDKHGVNCYFCGDLVDERECQNADEYNNNDGGTICNCCLNKFLEQNKIKCFYKDNCNECEYSEYGECVIPENIKKESIYGKIRMDK